MIGVFHSKNSCFEGCFIGYTNFGGSISPYKKLNEIATDEPKPSENPKPEINEEMRQGLAG
jgi:hypothetical protein